MSLLRQTAIQAYPKIQIDPGSVIKPCLASQNARDAFVERPVSAMRKLWQLIRNEGIILLLKTVTTANISYPEGFRMYAVRLARIFANALLQLHQMYSSIYAYFYPYSMMSHDVLCDEFSPCLNWSSALIRAFAWHPNYDRCAVAICNDCIYLYIGSQKSRILRHHNQKKIVDMVWNPYDKDVLAVATQTHIIIWRIGCSTSNNPSNKIIPSEGSSIKNQFTSEAALREHYKPGPFVVSSLKVFANIIAPPITNITFNSTGDELYICSPNSSNIIVIKFHSTLTRNSGNSNSHHDNDLKNGVAAAAVAATAMICAPQVDNSNQGTDYSIERIWRFGQCFTRLVMSPDKVRLAAATTSKFLRVFESMNWSSKDWRNFSDVIQHMSWSRPSGRILLVAPKNEPCLYAIPFFDEAQANDVGGIKSMIKALDLSEKLCEDDSFVGGCIQSFVWDQNGRRLAISFKDNPESILLFRTTEKPSVEFQQLGVIKSDKDATPLLMEFHDKFKDGSLLTVCWSDGNCQHIPMAYSSADTTGNIPAHIDSQNPDADSLINHNSPGLNSSRTLRPLTNFCHRVDAPPGSHSLGKL